MNGPDPATIALLVGLLLWINFLPPFARLLWGERFAAPVDGGRRFRDGRPLFGSHKTWRGIGFATFGALAWAPFLPLAWWEPAVVALAAMAGDVLTSFVKRRLDTPPGASRVVLDQFLEALFPAAYLAARLDLAPWQAAAVVLAFVILAFFGSRAWQHLTYQPPARNRLRIVRSAARLRQWRACHQPLARWQAWLNFEYVLYYRLVMGWVFRRLGLYRRGQENALAIELVRHTFTIPGLPPAFDGFSILLLTDLHLDGLPALADRLAAIVATLPVDLCLIGGDIRMETYGPIAPSVRRLRRVVRRIESRHGVFGVLGNHDCIEMVPELEDAGVVMLVNDAWPIERQGEQLWIVGVDDPHYYKVHDLQAAFAGVPEQACSILLAHSPELYREAVAYRPALYLCGHTHGGQICLPGGIKVFTHCRAPRPLCAGPWRYQGMWGYTSRGVGASGLPLRFNCAGEVTVITLRRPPAPASG